MRKWKTGILAGLLILSMTACTSQQTEDTAPTPTVTGTTEQETELTPTEAPEPTATNIPEPTVTPKPTATSTPVPTKAPEVTTNLQTVFAEYGLKTGTCLTDQMVRNQTCTDIILDNFNSITFENHMKPDYIFNQSESKKTGDLVVAFNSTADLLMDWCKENNMAMRGHVLIWHSQTPSWIFYDNFDTTGNLVDREVMLARMDSYIRQVFEQLEEMGYLECFYAYDVVNEAWMEDGSKRESLWLETIGDDYMWHAFNFANKYAPDYIDLYYNDYNEQYKTETLYNFVNTLVDEDGNYLIDGIGLQAHLYTDDNIDDYLKMMEKLGSTGLKVNLTELDVCLGSWTDIKPATEENMKEQGRYYYNLIHGILELIEEGKVKSDSLTFWGFADTLSWRKERSPMLYNRLYEPKYAYFGALQQKEYAGFE